jgi:flagellar biosynthesis/type III secretory pathway ATPase
MLLRVVAVTARLTTEMEELKRSRNSRSVWKLHADSLVVLVDLAKRLAEAVDRLALTIGQQPETQANSEPLRSSLERLRERTGEAAKLIALG